MKHTSAASGQIADIETSQLMLDTENPRFAGELENPGQRELIDYIAEDIGISDLLSSMSRRGYYRSHPLIGVQENNHFIIVEGNRRLVAALILSDDTRAINQKARARNYPLAPGVDLTRLPVLVAPSRSEVLPYIGIAHIVGNKKWDSFAKAAWAADVLDKGIYSNGVREIAAEIGDKHRTLERLVESFRIVKQLERASLFNPEDTIPKGKGIAKFPFSWVYTALSFQSVRELFGLPESGRSAVKDILSADKLDRAAEFSSGCLAVGLKE